MAKLRGKSNEGARYAWYNESKQFSNYLRAVRSASPMHKPIKSVKKFSILLFNPLKMAKLRGKSNEGARYAWYNESKQFSNYLRPVRSASPMHKPIKSVKKFSILLFNPLKMAKLRGKSNEGARYAWYNESKRFSNYLRPVRSASPMHKPIKSVKKFSILLFNPLKMAKLRGKSNEGARYAWYNESKQFSDYLRPVRSASPMHKPIKSKKKFSILLFNPLKMAKLRGKSNEGARYAWYNESKQFSYYSRPVRSASPMHKPIKSVKKFSILLFNPLKMAKLRGKSNEGARYAWYNESKQFSNYLRPVRSASPMHKPIKSVKTFSISLFNPLKMAKLRGKSNLTINRLLPLEKS